MFLGGMPPIIPAGFIFYKLTAGDEVMTKRMMLVK